MAFILKTALRNTSFFIIFIAGFVAGNIHLEAQNGAFPAFYDLRDTQGTQIKGFFDWDKGILYATVDLKLAFYGLKLPAGRTRADEILEDEYWRLLRPYLMSMQADSNSTINDLVMQGELSLETIDRAREGIMKIPASLTEDLSAITGRYTVPFSRISSALGGSRKAAVSIPRLFIPSPAADYTGIIIIADTNLPVHGRNSSAMLKPCLSPKIWDTEMTMIYEKNMAMPEILQSSRAMPAYTSAGNIFRPTPSGLDERLIGIVGTNPLRIMARKVFGAAPTDPVIEKEDALIILSTENNRRLLAESRIVLVVNDSVLFTSF
ncbi:MAG: polymerase [Treponema sp.]|jgi:hypothetical protein|nr:polymerase [Treponema sp.]